MNFPDLFFFKRALPITAFSQVGPLPEDPTLYTGAIGSVLGYLFAENDSIVLNKVNAYKVE